MTSCRLVLVRQACWSKDPFPSLYPSIFVFSHNEAPCFSKTFKPWWCDYRTGILIPKKTSKLYGIWWFPKASFQWLRWCGLQHLYLINMEYTRGRSNCSKQWCFRRWREDYYIWEQRKRSVKLSCLLPPFMLSRMHGREDFFFVKIGREDIEATFANIDEDERIGQLWTPTATMMMKTWTMTMSPSSRRIIYVFVHYRRGLDLLHRFVSNRTLYYQILMCIYISL